MYIYMCLLKQNPQHVYATVKRMLYITSMVYIYICMCVCVCVRYISIYIEREGSEKGVCERSQEWNWSP